MSGKSESISFANRDDAVKCYFYYNRLGSPYVPFHTFFDARFTSGVYSNFF